MYEHIAPIYLYMNIQRLLLHVLYMRPHTRRAVVWYNNSGDRDGRHVSVIIQLPRAGLRQDWRGTKVTCFTGTKVQILTQKGRLAGHGDCGLLSGH